MLVDIARQVCANASTVAKSLSFYAVYGQYFGPPRRATILELGVHTGESLKVFATYFPDGKIIGLDLAKAGPDFSGYSNIIYECGNQADRSRLEYVCDRHAPDGLDIIIDDAAHVGHYALISYATLFPRLRPGGLYIIEDWGTGYFDDWQDGGHYQRIIAEPVKGFAPKRLPSHDFGMVGFVKSLMDQAAGDNIRPVLNGQPMQADTIEFMHVYKGFVIIKKL